MRACALQHVSPSARESPAGTRTFRLPFPPPLAVAVGLGGGGTAEDVRLHMCPAACLPLTGRWVARGPATCTTHRTSAPSAACLPLPTALLCCCHAAPPSLQPFYAYSPLSHLLPALASLYHSTMPCCATLKRYSTPLRHITAANAHCLRLRWRAHASSLAGAYRVCRIAMAAARMAGIPVRAGLRRCSPAEQRAMAAYRAPAPSICRRRALRRRSAHISTCCGDVAHGGGQMKDGTFHVRLSLSVVLVVCAGRAEGG